MTQFSLSPGLVPLDLGAECDLGMYLFQLDQFKVEIFFENCYPQLNGRDLFLSTQIVLGTIAALVLVFGVIVLSRILLPSLILLHRSAVRSAASMSIPRGEITLLFLRANKPLQKRPSI